MKTFFTKTTVVLMFFLLGSAFLICSSEAASGAFYSSALADLPADAVVLYPGEARSLLYRFDGLLWDREGYHVALIAVVASDNEIHQLTISFTPVGDLGTELAFFTWGAFVSLPGNNANLFDFLAPKLVYANENVRYTVNTNLTVGFLFSTAVFEQSYVDFPIEMTMTLFLSD